MVIYDEMRQSVTTPMNEWGFNGYETFVEFGSSATYCKFKLVWLGGRR